MDNFQRNYIDQFQLYESFFNINSNKQWFVRNLKLFSYFYHWFDCIQQYLSEAKQKKKKKGEQTKKESESKIFTIIVHDFTVVEFHICQSRVSLGRSRGQTCENENFRQWTFSS